MSYNGAIKTRLDAAWNNTLYDSSGLPIPRQESLSQMRQRSTYLETNNALASSVLDRSDENTIGTGIRLRAATDSTTFNEKVNSYWQKLVEGKKFDVRRMFSFDQIQSLMYRSTHRDGDVGLMFIDRGFGPEIQMIEGASIDTPMNAAYNSSIVDGVEFGPSNNPVAYHVVEVAPVTRLTQYKRVLARDIIFVPRTTRYNIARGLTTFHGTYSLFEQIVALLETAIVAMRVGAAQALIVKVKRGTIGTRSSVLDAKGNTVQSRVIEPGMINFVEVGDEISSFNPQQPGTNFTESVRTFARFIGLKWGLTLERVLLDFSKANYSVSRSTALQEQRTAAREQWFFNQDVFARLWPWFVSKSIKSGKIEAGPVPDDAWKYSWTPNGRPLVEPSKDAAGLKILTDMGLPPQEIFEEMGYDSNELIDRCAEWKTKRAEKGLPTFGFMEQVMQSDTPQDDDDGEDEDEDEDEKDEDSKKQP